MWPFKPKHKDPRGHRLVCAIECLFNQNARDEGAAESAAATPGLSMRLSRAGVGMVQIPCPEMACLGHRRGRAPGQSIRDALQTPEAADCCASQAAAMADRIQAYQREGIDVAAILGGNVQSPGCAVHAREDDPQRLAARSGLYMLALEKALEKRGLNIPFRGMRDADPQLLADDLEWLARTLSRN